MIDDIFLEEEEADEQEEEQIEDIDRVLAENIIDIDNVNVTETQKVETKDIPPLM